MSELLEELLQENARLGHALGEALEKYMKLLRLAIEMIEVSDDLRDFIDEEIK